MEDKLSDTALYSVSLKELKAQASPGKAPRQVSDCFIGGSGVLVIRNSFIYESIVLVVTCTIVGDIEIRRSRGLLPRDFKVSETGLLAELTRCKVSG